MGRGWRVRGPRRSEIPELRVRGDATGAQGVLTFFFAELTCCALRVSDSTAEDMVVVLLAAQSDEEARREPER